MSEWFIPIAVNKQETSHSAAWKAAHSDEFKLIETFTGGKTSHLGIYLLTPEGEPLSDKNLFRVLDAAETRELLAAARSRFEENSKAVAGQPRQVEPEWRDKDRGLGVREDGSLRIALYARHTDLANGKPPAPVFDSLVLSRQEWQALVPDGDGETVQLAEDSARLFARILPASSDLSNLISPADLSVAELSARPEQVGGERWIWLDGKVAGKRPYVNGGTIGGHAALRGVLVLSAERRPLRLRIVAAGQFKLPWDRADRPTAALLEWQAE